MSEKIKDSGLKASVQNLDAYVSGIARPNLG